MITFEPALSWAWIYTLAACGIVATLISAVFARRSFPIRVCLITALLQLLALALVLLALSNPVQRGDLPLPAPGGRQVVLLDTSKSMSLGSPSRLSEGLDWVKPLLDAKHGGVDTRLVTFDSGSDLSGKVPLTATGTESRLSQAIERVLSQPGSNAPVHFVVISDGVFDDPKEISQTLGKLRDRRIAVSTHLTGREETVPNLWIARIDAPRFAPTESQVPVAVEIQSKGFPAQTRVVLRVTGGNQRLVAERAVELENEHARAEFLLPLGLQRETFTVQFGALPAEISDSDNRVTFPIEPLNPKIRVFLAEGSKGLLNYGDERWNVARFFPTAFRRSGNIECDLFQMPSQDLRGQPLYLVKGFDDSERAVLDEKRTIPGDRDGWWAYDVVIISDIDRQTFSQKQMEWIRQLVTERGGGFMMLGGNQSFDTGNYDQTLWEKLIPVDCLQFGFGHGWRPITPSFPAAARRHPILQIAADPKLNDRILDVHPPFRGYHDIRRVKPGAVTLATVESNGAPLMAVQDYGRGRTVAFLSDPAGGWAEEYAGVWGPGLLINESSADASVAERELVEDASLPLNEFYNRFWVNTIRWLAAHSIRRQDRTLLGATSAAVVRPGERLPVSAELRSGDSSTEFAQWSVGVRLGGTNAERVPLRFDRDRQEFVGEIPIPADRTAGEAKLFFDAIAGGQNFSDTLTVPVVRFEREFERTTPDARFMEDIARGGGGRVLHDAREAFAVAEQALRSASSLHIPYAKPVWDRPWFWAALMAILGAKWWLWRRHNGGAPQRNMESTPGTSKSQSRRFPDQELSPTRSQERKVEELVARLLLVAFLFLASQASAAAAFAKNVPVAIAEAARVCLVIGHPGDAAHHEKFQALREQLTRTFTQRFGIAPPNLTVFDSTDAGLSARERLLDVVRTCAKEARPDAATWFVFIGHANTTRTGTSFNLHGPDLTEADLSSALEQAQPQGAVVFLLTQASSGRWIRPLAGPARFFLAATRPTDEENETELPEVLATALEAPGTDLNKDGVISLTELFERCRIGVQETFERSGFMQKEAPTLEANGDGRGTSRSAPEDIQAASSIGLKIHAPVLSQHP